MSDAATKIDGEDDVNRLHDILVHEVSLVDRAANKRKFLMLKRGKDMADQTGAEVVETEDGKLTTIEETNKVENLSIQSDAKAEILQVATKALSLVTTASELIKNEEDDTSAEGIPADIAKELSEARTLLFALSEKYASVDDEARKGIAPTDKATTLRMATESLERLVAVVGIVESADGVEKSDAGVPTEITGELMAVARLVSGLIERYAAPEAAPTEKVVAKGWAARPADEVSKGGDTLAALAKAVKVIKPVEKAGRKISGDRLTKLRSIAKELIELLREVSPEDFDEVVAAQAAKTAKAAKPTKPADPEPEKPETDVVVSKGIDPMVLAELANAKTAITAANAEIARLKKSFDLPNSMIEETVSKPKEVGSPNVTWPADMNRPITKDSVQKGHWFDLEE